MDGKYRRCLELAQQSPCQKRGFGCLLTNDRQPTVETFNWPIECAGNICQPSCIRLRMKSGADPLIGACGHAEELAIWKTINRGDLTNDAVLYVAGVSKPDNTPLILDKPSFYCLRCATAMFYSGVRGVNVYVGDQWIFMTAQEAYDSSLGFAL